ncbi:MAG: VWA domain-containing protein [Flavobacteriales bacterium]|nr:VWA domain-containing protein [Flavobacteriales bacterium]
MAIDFNVESPDNYEQKCLLVLLVDVSGSMSGTPIAELNRGLQEFYSDIQQDSTTANRLEVCIVEFSSTVETLVTPSLVSSFTMPQLSVKGSTKMVDGMKEAIAVVDARKAWYKSTGQPYYRPWIVLITDGAPDPGQDIEWMKNEIQSRVDAKSFHFYALGVTSADMQMLTRVSHPTTPPAMLNGLRFAEFFKWLSASMSMIANSKEGEKTNLPSPSNWMQGFQV